MRKTPVSGFPRALLSLSHAQKTRALGWRLMASLVLTPVFALARFLNAWSEFVRLLPCRVTRHRRLCQCLIDFLSNLGSVTFSRFLLYYLRTDLINGSCHALENIGSSSALDGYEFNVASWSTKRIVLLLNCRSTLSALYFRAN